MSNKFKNITDLNLYFYSILNNKMKSQDPTNQISVDLTKSEWNSILAILQTHAKQEHQHGNNETAEEIQRLHDDLARQL